MPGYVIPSRDDVVTKPHADNPPTFAVLIAGTQHIYMRR